MFKKILVANRGEVALRVVRACKEMGINTVAVHSEADRDSLHVRYADESICIGPNTSVNSYLHIPSIISAAEITDAEAIHPGYGFLAENSHFAEICESCDIRFIGPSSRAIRLMGDKIRAKRIMKKSGVPVILGTIRPIKSKEEALKFVKEVGYPVIIKAAGGGGGRGMRIAHNDVRLVNAIMTAQAEAESAFGNADVYIERYLENPRHIEFQILADKYGNMVHLGERDCTIQRRYQKLIEESPSPVIKKRLRKKMGEVALKAAKSIKYVNAGTVEFLLDKEGKFYFMEMNTRIQVEHPVTELVTGIDIVKEQIRIAAGEKLGYKQDDIYMDGSSIECRINAEDTEKDFLPSPGKITSYNAPGGPGVRVDSHAHTEYVVQPYYDSMIAKLIVHGKNRQEAIARMKRALEEYVVEGIKTTIPLYRRIFEDPTFNQGKMTTDYINKLVGSSKEK